MENKEIKIGEVGTIDGYNVKCVLSNGLCQNYKETQDCFFYDLGNGCSGEREKQCYGQIRKDKKEVCYKIVK